MEMRHEVILKREGGKKVKILVTFSSDHHWQSFEYKVFVDICEHRKRTFKRCFDSDSYEFRKIDLRDRPDYIKQKQLEHVTEQEIYDAKTGLWRKLHP